MLKLPEAIVEKVEASFRNSGLGQDVVGPEEKSLEIFENDEIKRENQRTSEVNPSHRTQSHRSLD